MEPLPKFVVAALVFIRQGDGILLVRQSYGAEYWSLPGGVVEAGESIEEAARREVREETGLEVRILRVIGIYSMTAQEAIAITLEAEIIGGRLQPDNEISDCAYFLPEQLPSPVRSHLYERVSDFVAGLPYTVLKTQ